MREPDKKGAGTWKAWRSNFDRTAPAGNTTIALWLLYCPGAHPLWSYHALSVITLADVEGAEPAKKTAPNMTHEAIVMSLDPDQPSPDPDKPGWSYLRPFDLVHQFEIESDERAAKLCEMIVDQVMTGSVSLDQDFRSYWKRAIDATAKHWREHVN